MFATALKVTSAFAAYLDTFPNRKHGLAALELVGRFRCQEDGRWRL